MKSKKTLILLVLVFILLLAGAAFLYDRLGEEYAPDQLAIQTQPQTTTPVQETTKPAEQETTEPAKMTAPDFTVYDAQGNKVNLSDFFGKPIVLNFWASWCGPGKMEMPDFQEKYLTMGEELQFLMVNMTAGRETRQSADEFITQQGYTFPVFYDLDADAAYTYSATSLPTTYFISAEGHLVARAVGAIDANTLQRGIDMICGG